MWSEFVLTAIYEAKSDKNSYDFHKTAGHFAGFPRLSTKGFSVGQKYACFFVLLVGVAWEIPCAVTEKQKVLRIKSDEKGSAMLYNN